MIEEYLPWMGLLILFLWVVFTILYGFGAAIQNIGEPLIEEGAEAGDWKAVWIQKQMEKPKMLTGMIHFISALLWLAYSGCVLVCVSRLRLFPELSLVWNRVITAVLALLLGLLIQALSISLPKYLAGKYPEKWAFPLVGIIRLLYYGSYPFVWLQSVVCFLGLKLFGEDYNAAYDSVTEEEIISIVNEGHEQGVLEASEAEMISNIFEFGDINARDIMTHRTAVTAVEGTLTLQEAMNMLVDENFSRYPVYLEDMDNIIGDIHFRDVVCLMMRPEYHHMQVKDVPGLVREAYFVPEGKSVSQLLSDMQAKKTHIAMVIDEYGQLAGILTMEDILERIVGDILDEYDEAEENIQEKDGVFLAEGSTALEELAEPLHLEFEDEDAETLNGFLISRLDRILQDGETPEVIACGYRFQVLEVEGKMIRQVRISPAAGEGEEAAVSL